METGVVIRSLPTKTRSGAGGFGAEFYQTFPEDLTAIHLRLSHKIKTEEHYTI